MVHARNYVVDDDGDDDGPKMVMVDCVDERGWVKPRAHVLCVFFFCARAMFGKRL